MAEHFVGRGDFVLASYRVRHPDLPGVEWLGLQSEPAQSLAAALDSHRIDVIIHAAGRINGPAEEVVAANEGSTTALLTAIASASAKPVIYYLSTVSAIAPTGVYGASKYRAERLIAEGAPGRWAVLRASLLHGAHDTKNVAVLVRAAKHWIAIPVVGGSHVKLQPLYVGDLVQAFDALVAGRGPSGTVYTVSGARQERLVDMIRAIQNKIERHAPLLPIPLAPVRLAIAAADKLLPVLNLPVQQVRALHGHPMYHFDEAGRDLGFAPRLFAESLTDYL